MNKKEYMEILIDYLSDNVSSDEKEEIIRDVEEMIEDGKLSGRNEEEVVSHLGSPKRLVSELKGEEIFFDKKEEEKIDDKKASYIDINKVKKQTRKKIDNFKKKYKVQKPKNNIFKRILKVCTSIFVGGIMIPFQFVLAGFICGLIGLIAIGVTSMILLAKVSLALMFASIFGIMIVIGVILVLADLFKFSLGVDKILINITKRNFIGEKRGNNE